jgi:hypothetical protein
MPNGRRWTPINADEKQDAYLRLSAFIGGAHGLPHEFSHFDIQSPLCPCVDSH